MLKQSGAAIRRFFKSSDMLLLAIALAISVFGLVLIYSSALRLPGGSASYLTTQTFGIVLGVIGFIIMSLIELDRFPKLWILLFIFNVLFQLSLYFFGEAGDTGNRSWIRFAGIGVQPGEVGKIIFIFTLASHMRLLRGSINKFSSLLQLVAHLMITAAAVYAFSRDLGVTLMYPLIFVGMIIASGVSMWWIGGMAGAGLLALPIVWNFISDSQKNRILVIFEPSLDPARAWQAQNAQAAIANGELFGQGLTQGEIVQSGWVPANHNDSIFATCGEELGFIGSVALLLLLAFLVFRIFYDGYRCRSYVGMLISVGVGSMFLFQILINVGMNMGIMPVIGLTLPLVSYGGTSVLTTLASLGLVSGYVRRRRPSHLDPE